MSRGFNPATSVKIFKNANKDKVRIRYAPHADDETAMEAAEWLFYKYAFGKYAEHRKGRMRVLCRTTGPKTRRKHLAEQFARNLIRYKERLNKRRNTQESRKISKTPPRSSRTCKRMQNSNKHGKKQMQDWYQRRTGSKKSLVYGEMKRGQERDES